MPSARLQQQFIRLWQCCEGKSQDTTLNELAALLSCSRRHMRTLLNTMQDRGWLTWEAEVGRGKRSRLTFLYTGLALQQQRAEDLLEQDRMVASKAMVPLIHHWLIIQGQRSMRGLRMNTLGWFDFKSAWFAPPDP